MNKQISCHLKEKANIYCNKDQKLFSTILSVIISIPSQISASYSTEIGEDKAHCMEEKK